MVNVLRVHDIAPAFGHRLSVHDQMCSVKIIVREDGAGIRFDNGNVVVMMAVNIVNSAAVYVDLAAQVLDDHGRILYVPGRASLPHHGIPPLDVSIAVAVPEDEIAQIPAVAVIRVPLETD